MVNDIDPSNQTYADNRLQELLIVAAQFVAQEVSFNTTYTIDVDQLLLAPDPTIPNNRDDSFINLICLKAACILDLAETRVATSQAFGVRDGGTSIDMRGSAEARLKFLKAGWCGKYEEAKDQYAANGRNIAGAAIMGPFKMFAYGVYGGMYPNPGRY
jgi:hypothetical protein